MARTRLSQCGRHVRSRRKETYRSSGSIRVCRVGPGNLQRSGYAAALSDSRVIEAIRSGPNGRIAVTFVEWSGPLSQNIVIDWMVISDDKTARLFGDHIVEASRAFANSTSISAGIDFAMTQLDRAPSQAPSQSSD